jgi:hypothetical protein
MTEVSNNSVIFYSSIVLFAVISWAIYKFVLTTHNNNNNNAAVTLTSSSAAAGSGGGGLSQNNNNGTSGGNAINSNNKEEEDTETSIFTYRFPPHLYVPPSQQQKGGPTIDLSSSHLYQGIIPFRSTFASGYETRLSSSSSSSPSSNNKEAEEENIIIINRKSRARIFAKIFSIKLATDRPPGRGSNVVVVISYRPNVIGSANDGSSGGRSIAKCEKLQKSLMLLATYYNLFLLVNVEKDDNMKEQNHQGGDYNSNEEEEKRRRDMVRQFRSDLLNITNSNSSNNNAYDGAKLNSQILPPHRIIFTSTSEGQVAFVRQLVDTKLVLLPSSEEGDKVKMELERFGFRVVCYPENNGSSGGVDATSYSVLGQFLIP